MNINYYKSHTCSRDNKTTMLIRLCIYIVHPVTTCKKTVYLASIIVMSESHE